MPNVEQQVSIRSRTLLIRSNVARALTGLNVPGTVSMHWRLLGLSFSTRVPASGRLPH